MPAPLFFPKGFVFMKHTTLCYIEKDGKYLMLHRVKKKNDVNHDKWIGIGGHIESGETVDECILRETKEETGLTLTSFRKCGEILFDSAPWPEEMMHLYYTDDFTGELTDCDEGELVWLEKEKLRELPAWEGDFIFLDLMERNVPYFYLELHYNGEVLDRAILNSVPLPLPGWKEALDKLY